MDGVADASDKGDYYMGKKIDIIVIEARFEAFKGVFGEWAYGSLSVDQHSLRIKQEVTP